MMYYYEACSLRQIENRLLIRDFKSKSDIREHMEFLESLADIIYSRVRAEQEAGAMAWGDELDLKKVKNAFFQLSDILKLKEEEAKLRQMEMGEFTPKALF